nr:MAG TPA: Helix-turn-helix XRE-family like protein [Caudoviricetes sp.]DAY44457.1 MAG TPA: Helix-turn-helix XRE-family like protein [Caudoviricetes sp.]
MTASKTDELNKNAEIAYNLKRIRAERGVSQAEFAKAIGISQSLLAMIETGARTITVPISIKIARYLNCSVSEIIGE